MIDLARVQAAALRIAGSVVRTPFLHSRVLSSLTGARISIKFENHQFTASFKERGALNRLLQLTAEQKARGVSAMSAGNHAQGVAYHAQRLGIPALIVMPVNTPFIKVEHTRAFQAEVVLAGETLADAQEEVRRLTAARGLTLVHPYDDAEVMAGQGTVALEMLADAPGLDTLVVPIGGGGLISGIATAAKGLDPAIEIVGVQSDMYPSMLRALAGEAPQGAGGTIAEGIAVKHAGIFTREIVRRLVAEVLLVSDPQLERAIALLLNVEKTVAEGAGAAGLAAVLAHPERFHGRNIGLVLCGGNIDPRLLASVLMRELVRERRVVTVRVRLPDHPGLLALLTGVTGRCGGNILEVRHHRTALGIPAKEASVELTFEGRDAAHARAVMQGIADAGLSFEEIDF